MNVHLALMTGGRNGMADMRRRVRRTERGAQGRREKINGGNGGVMRGDCALNDARWREKWRNVHESWSAEDEERATGTDEKDERWQWRCIAW